jgi:hypothetical protein
MTLFNELQERWKAIFLERESVEKRADELAEDMQELEVALKALHELHAKPEDEPQEMEASSQSESCVPSLGAETDLQTSPGEAEESRDQFEEEATRAAAIELTADVPPEPEFIELDQETCEPVQPQWNEPQTEGYAPVTDADRYAKALDRTNRATDAEIEKAISVNEARVTNPEADALAKAHDYYSPEKVAERQKFNPFGMFRREPEGV